MKSLVLLLASLAAFSARADDVALSTVVDRRNADSEHARVVSDKNAKNEPLRIAGKAFRSGVGTQVDTRLAVLVNGATHLTAVAGVDDATEATAAVRFAIEADGQPVWQQQLKKGDAPAAIDLDVTGRKQLVFITCDVGNNDTKAYADWADGKFAFSGERPKSSVPPSIVEKAEILTPAAPATPRINSAHVFGVRPGRPFLFTIAATGDRPMTFAATGLPEGLTLDATTGQITGSVTSPGTYRVTLSAKNGRGTAESPLRIEVGDKIALTPPLGWNSWNCWGISVDQDKVLASARAMSASGLINHGWTYVNIDDTWQGARTGPDHALESNSKFPDMKKLCDEIHALGLKAGIYSTPWTTSYATHAGGSSDDPNGAWEKPAMGERPRRILGKYSFAKADAKQWAAWGMDYLKYDWNPNQPPETKEMSDALRDSGRDIIYSLSNSAPFANAAILATLANCWRTTGDIHDSWGSLRGIWAQQEKWRPYGGPGHWNDPDMLVVGEVDVGSGRNLHPSRLTPNEQYTHISLWCLLSAPLLIGCPIERLDPFTMNLLTNDEVLAIDQDELGSPAAQVIVDGRKEIYVKQLADGSHAVGLFNLAQEPQEVSAAWSALNLGEPTRVRDLWRQQDQPVNGEKVSATVPRHGVVLLRVWSKK